MDEHQGIMLPTAEEAERRERYLMEADAGLQELSLPTLEDMETRYLVEDEKGMLTSVPESGLSVWSGADHSAPLNRQEQRAKEEILRRISALSR